MQIPSLSLRQCTLCSLVESISRKKSAKNDEMIEIDLGDDDDDDTSREEKKSEGDGGNDKPKASIASGGDDDDDVIDLT